MKVKKGNVTFEPTPSYRCPKRRNHPRMISAQCWARGDNPVLYPECVNCQKSIRRVPFKNQKEKHDAEA